MFTDRQRLAPLVASVAPIVGLASGPAQAQFVFEPSVEYGQMLSPGGMTSGDFDGDGDIDLATTAGGPERVARSSVEKCDTYAWLVPAPAS